MIESYISGKFDMFSQYEFMNKSKINEAKTRRIMNGTIIINSIHIRSCYFKIFKITTIS